MARVAAAVYLVAVLAFCLTPQPTALSTPLAEATERVRPDVAPDAPAEVAIETYTTAGRRLDTIVNLAMLVPLGALVAIGWRERSLPQFAFGVVAISGGIEILQLVWVTARTPQWSDVGLNTAGALLTFLATRALLARWVPSPPHRRPKPDIVDA